MRSTNAAPTRWRSEAIAETAMRPPILILVAAAWSLSSPAFGDDGSGDFPPPILHDPSLATSVYFPPAITTAGVATIGPALGTASQARALPCSRTNPCAIATPAADFALPAR